MKTLKERIDAFMATTVEGYNWSEHYNQNKDSPQGLFRQTITMEPVKKEERYYQCDDIMVDPRDQDWRPAIKTTTPEALFRLFFLLETKGKIDLTEMYRVDLLQFRSWDKKFMVIVGLRRYEMILLFFHMVKPTYTEGDPFPDLTPCTDPDGIAFFDMVKCAIGRKWRIYDGNDFIV